MCEFTQGLEFSQIYQGKARNNKEKLRTIQEIQGLNLLYTPGSMNSLFSDVFSELWRDILTGVRDYLGEILGGFQRENEGKLKEHNIPKKNQEKT